MALTVRFLLDNQGEKELYAECCKYHTPEICCQLEENLIIIAEQLRKFHQMDTEIMKNVKLINWEKINANTLGIFYYKQETVNHIYFRIKFIPKSY